LAHLQVLFRAVCDGGLHSMFPSDQKESHSPSH
jgi:hypothetical protein